MEIFNNAKIILLFLFLCSITNQSLVNCLSFTTISKSQNHILSHNHYRQGHSCKTWCKSSLSNSDYSNNYEGDGDRNDGENNGIEYVFLEEEEEEEDQDWISDRDLIRRATDAPGGEALTNRKSQTYEKIKYANLPDNDDDDADKNGYNNDDNNDSGKKKQQHKREPGYLGDSSLKEIAMDFSIPICYIADVLVSWGCPIPIDVTMNLGDLVTGEQAFALLEAIHTLDISTLQDRYSNYDLMTIAQDYDIELKEAFEYALKKGWSLPFGVQTCLRVEQEDEMIMALAEEELTNSLDQDE